MDAEKMNAKKMVLTALLIALVTVTTMIVNIPLPGVRGYVNIGDTVVLLAGLIFGPLAGAVSGALGASLADLLLGYAYWAPWTFVIKGLEGFLAGWVVRCLGKATTLGATLGALVMVLGYFLVGILYYGLGPAVTSLPGDLVQGGVSVALALLLVPPIRKYLSL
ncbi:MAG TPA: ECF transporter S component [Firmicutes bacterium]|nr:ECF transporter S component [Bacillota bacterium]